MQFHFYLQICWELLQFHFYLQILLGTATCNIASKMTSQELAIVPEKLAKIEHKQDEYQSNFLNSPSVIENADASAFVSGASIGKGKKNCWKN